MARNVKMSEISRDGIVIPGGWLARMPEIEISAADLAAYISYFTRQGWPVGVAEGFVREAMQKVFERGWSVGLREMIALKARDFMKMGGSLEDFDPSAISAAYVPFENRGRPGKPAIKRRLLEMRREATAPQGEFTSEESSEEERDET
jgi:hypothetical protein